MSKYKVIHSPEGMEHIDLNRKLFEVGVGWHVGWTVGEYLKKLGFATKSRSGKVSISKEGRKFLFDEYNLLRKENEDLGKENESLRKSVGCLQRVIQDIHLGKLNNPTLIDRKTGETSTYLDMLLKHTGWRIEAPKEQEAKLPLFESEVA